MTDAPEDSVDWRRALAWRAGRHLLDPVGGESVAGVVRRLGAVLSMDDDRAELAVRTRRRTSRAGEVARALADGSVVQAFAFRGAMHYLAPEDAGLYLSLRCAGRQWELPSWVEFYRLGPEDWPDFRAAVRAALDGGPLTVPELGEALARDRRYRHLRAVFDDGAGTLVKPLTWQGDVGIAPRREGRMTLQRMDASPRWAGVPDLEEAGPRAVTAYVRSYGPVPRENLHYWLGAGLSVGRRLLDRWVTGLGDRLAVVDVEGTAAYVDRRDLDALAAAEPSEAVRFLPGHDQWVMGVGTHDEHVTPPGLRPAMTRKAHPVLVGGEVRGTWSRTGDDLSVTWPSGRVPRTRLAEETERLGGILGRDLRLDVRS